MDYSVSAQLAIQHRLRDALLQARARNPAYSLRAFSKKVGVGHSAISEILAGKRSVSRKMVERIVQGLQMSPHEAKPLCDLFLEKNKKGSGVEYAQLSADQFHLISDWYYFAILSLVRTRDFKATPSWIARRLNIRTTEAEMALRRLQRMNLLVKNSEGRWVRGAPAYTTTDGVADDMVRRAQLTTLQLAGKSLQRNELQDTDFTFMTMAIDPKKMPFAKKMIREFEDKFPEYLEAGEQTEVYRLAIQFFPLSNLRKAVKNEKGTIHVH